MPVTLPRHDRKTIQARYDAAQDTDEFSRYWQNADRLDADSAHSRPVREKLVSRSRYEVGNNGYSDGIAKTYATDLVGTGPQLRMTTSSPGFNKLVETTWQLWSKAVQLRRKLWCMAHAKFMDGESFAVLRQNPGLRRKTEILLDLELRETEQCQSLGIQYGEGIVDGVRFDSFGNPVAYEFLIGHPGSTGAGVLSMDGETVAADRVLQWFRLRRPGQHRQVPECASTLNVGAASRRFREATVAAAETAADLNVLLKTQMHPDLVTDEIASLSTLPIEKRMMTALPVGWDGEHMRSEHPNATYDDFQKRQVNEQARPASMPTNKAMCDSSDYNFASGRLDHGTYYAEIDVDREDGNDLVLDPLFDIWFDLAIVTLGWLGGNPLAIGPAAKSHLWGWSQHPVVDSVSHAKSNETRLKTGQAGLHQIYSEAGRDLEDEIPKMAETFGVSEQEIRRRLLDVILPPSAPAPTQTDAEDDPTSEAMFRRLVTPTLNGVTNSG